MEGKLFKVKRNQKYILKPKAMKEAKGINIMIL